MVNYTNLHKREALNKRKGWTDTHTHTHTHTHSPIPSKVVGYDEFAGNNNVIKIDILAHGPQLKANSTDWCETEERSLILKEGRVVNLPGSPLTLGAERDRESCEHW